MAGSVHWYSYQMMSSLSIKNHLWAGSMSTIGALRLNPDTGTSVRYLLLRQTNVRRVFVDDSVKPVNFWIGSNHGASIIKLTPLDLLCR